MRDLEAIADFINETIVEAGYLLTDRFKDVKVSTKGDVQNTVTDSDLLSEELITKAIEQHYAGDLILGEEADQNVQLESEHLWIIDPLDGTNNYASGMPHFGISIAYCEKGEPVVGAVYDPTREELFIAVKGKGTTLNGEPVAVATRPVLAEGLVCTGFYYDRGALMEKTLDSLKNLFHHGVRGIRRTGSAALDLAWVAAGRFDGFFEYQLSVWDFAAGALLVTEAGGVITERDGSEFSLCAKGVICGSNEVQGELVDVVKWEE